MMMGRRLSKTFELEKCNKKMTEMRKKSNDEGVLRKELEKQAQEINSLTNGLA